MSEFDEAKQKITDKTVLRRIDYLDDLKTKFVRLDDVLAILGDLQKDYALKEEDLAKLKVMYDIVLRKKDNYWSKLQDLEGKCEEYAKLVARQAEQYAEEWDEAQKTVREALRDFPVMTNRRRYKKYADDVEAWRIDLEYKLEKAEKLLEPQP